MSDTKRHLQYRATLVKLSQIAKTLYAKDDSNRVTPAANARAKAVSDILGAINTLLLRIDE